MCSSHSNNNNNYNKRYNFIMAEVGAVADATEMIDTTSNNNAVKDAPGTTELKQMEGGATLRNDSLY